MEVCFVTPLDVQEIDDDNWILTSDFVVTVDGKTFTVPKGFKTDFASVPRVPFAYWMFGNIGHRPAVIHDYLYTLGGTQEDKTFADDVLLHGIIADGDSSIKAHAMWTAVHLFGGSHWIQKSGDQHG